ncbi:MAG: alanine racemase C-terminal domain-containing protein, partial [Litorivicinaceae bacterium]
GQRCPIVGRVSMDLITVDVSSLASVNEGTWVEIMGAGISVDTVAAKANTIGYECLTRLGARMERMNV